LPLLRQASAAGQPFRVALLDGQMPEMDGPALAHAIRAEPALAGTQLILMATLCGSAASQAAASVCNCLVKPLKTARLREALRAALSNNPDAKQPPQPLAGAIQTPEASAPGQGLRILLAEDNAVNRRLALTQLSKLGYAADPVVNGRELLEAVQKKPYDLILVDCQMPEMDGYEATARLREWEKTRPPGQQPPVYVIALTANALGGDRERGFAAGMDDYLTKPVRLKDLRSALERAARRIQPRPQFSAPEAQPAVDSSVLVSLHELREPGQPDPVAALIQLYLKDSKPKVELLESLAAARKGGEMKAAAHSLKGSSKNLGACRLAALLQEIEGACVAEQWEQVQRLWPQIKAEFRLVEEELQRELEA
jgi:CheY-like chemotaxis protein/HPt (histidine-containing phosphotransfer) domain-containing protein